ncbi:MAG: hypothetical protein AAF603_07450, partial [Pseudomonadota bacterium]
MTFSKERPAVEIRPATLEDAANIAQLHYKIFQQSEWSEGYWQAMLMSDHHLVYLAYREDAIIGLYALRFILDEAEILTLGV